MRRLLLQARIFAFLLALPVLAPLAANATPVVYTTSGGSATITAFVNNVLIAGPVVVGFTGSGSVTFDDAVPEVLDITFSLAAIGPITLAAPWWSASRGRAP